MKLIECHGDLVALERRGVLSAAERRIVDAHVAVCTSCRLAREIGGDFDLLSPADPDDAERIRRMAETGEQWARQRSGWLRRTDRARRTPLLLVAACVAMIGGIAGATLGLRHRLLAESSDADSSLRAPAAKSLRASFAKLSDRSARAPLEANPPKATSIAAAGPSAAPVEAVPVAENAHAVESDPVSARAEPPRASAARAPRVAAAPQVESAAALFRAAGEARRNGDARGAAQLYRKLQKAHAESPEAVMSEVPFGVLLLGTAEPRAALEQFDRYLESPRLPLRAEAFYGRARALAALGDAPAEKQTWTRLLAEFPTCPYATMARRRLSELE